MPIATEQTKVTEFWIHLLREHPIIGAEITEKDVAVLKVIHDRNTINLRIPNQKIQ